METVESAFPEAIVAALKLGREETGDAFAGNQHGYRHTGKDNGRDQTTEQDVSEHRVPIVAQQE